MPKEIVWVEDDIDIISSVVRPLELAGYNIVKLRSSSEANKAIDRIRQADLVLLDMLLPIGKNGSDVEDYEGLRLLRNWYATYKTDFPPVVVFSVITSDQVVSELRKIKIVAGILSKPARPSELKQKIERALQVGGEGAAARTSKSGRK